MSEKNSVKKSAAYSHLASKLQKQDVRFLTQVCRAENRNGRLFHTTKNSEETGWQSQKVKQLSKLGDNFPSCYIPKEGLSNDLLLPQTFQIDLSHHTTMAQGVCLQYITWSTYYPLTSEYLRQSTLKAFSHFSPLLFQLRVHPPLQGLRVSLLIYCTALMLSLSL